MNEFAHTEVDGVSISRMVAGSNWWLGFSHQTAAKSRWIIQYQTARKIADILEVFLREGIDVTMGTSPLLAEAVQEAQQRVGRKMYQINTPNFEVTPSGPDYDDFCRKLDECVGFGATFCWPHACVTDRLYDGMSGTIRYMDRICGEIRQRGMIPGLSTHRPECIVAADKTALDVASYICLYNAAGFLMPHEIDWVRKIIHEAAKPITTIKPMAAGRLMPSVGLPFVWSTLRDCDLVTVGTMTPDEAREVIEISCSCLEHRSAEIELQTTRSKKTLLDR